MFGKPTKLVIAETHPELRSSPGYRPFVTRRVAALLRSLRAGTLSPLEVCAVLALPLAGIGSCMVTREVDAGLCFVVALVTLATIVPGLARRPFMAVVCGLVATLLGWAGELGAWQRSLPPSPDCAIDPRPCESIGWIFLAGLYVALPASLLVVGGVGLLVASVRSTLARNTPGAPDAPAS